LLYHHGVRVSMIAHNVFIECQFSIPSAFKCTLFLKIDQHFIFCSRDTTMCTESPTDLALSLARCLFSTLLGRVQVDRSKWPYSASTFSNPDQSTQSWRLDRTLSEAKPQYHVAIALARRMQITTLTLLSPSCDEEQSSRRSTRSA